ncbi:hypothetical protein TNCT_165071 [Trichonephila clavata]|uniref:Uncharacterized protein n=1 Tax=Trichonephila clavata TaxID=2740835 RepID=A0A8X6KBX0_TRICU|nr:hypothetical protein TNCT_165071 [Trichonephila clavata]
MFENATKEDLVAVLKEMGETVDSDLRIMELKQKLMLTEKEDRAKEEARHIAEKEARLKAVKETKILEARCKAEEEAGHKAGKESKAVEERRNAQEEMKMNERITLEEETRLEKEIWLVQEQMQHVQEEHKMRTIAEKHKCLQEEKRKTMEE